MDEILLRGLRVVGTHGVLVEEQERAQPFEIDLCIAADLAPPAASDALGDTIDYGEVAGVVGGIVADEHYALLERLAGRIADAVLGLDGRIAAVTVTVTKLRPPVPLDLSSAAVRLHRVRPS